MVALPGRTWWTGGGGSSSVGAPRPDRTMKGRLCCTYSGGYASIGNAKCYLSMKLVGVKWNAGRDGTSGGVPQAKCERVAQDSGIDTVSSTRLRC